MTSRLESVDSVVVTGTPTSYVTLSIIGVGMTVLLNSAGLACALSLGNKVLQKIIINNNNKYKK